ncbi:MAG: CGNR zinc finger domain-containing protein [Terriglobia bacterium]
MPRPPPPPFVADSLGLDFLNSITTSRAPPLDRISDGEGLLSWLAQAHLVPLEVLRDMRAKTMPGELDRVAAQARDLREWFRTFVRAHKGRPLEATAVEELAPLNRLLERDENYGIVTSKTGREQGLRLEGKRRWKSPESLLLPIGEALARLVTEENFADVKACEGPACTKVFADHTRGKNRRWCSMEVCGNRAKQTAHRQRAKK